MKRILFAIFIIISLTGDSYSQRIPFAFWNRASPDSIELETPILVAPADDTTGVSQQDALLDWEGVIYATNYIVQLSADGNFASPIWSDTTVNSKAVIELGLEQGSDWYWRVLAYNLFDTSEWSDTNSFTVTTGPALTTPVLTFPADVSTGISQNPVLDWDTVINVRHYVAQISASTSFSSLVWSDSVTVSTATVYTDLDFDSTYYWRVIAYNNFDTSLWSDTNSFTVQSENIAAPTLITPTNGATGQSQSPTLTWGEVEDADFYNVQLTQYSDFSSILWNQNTFDTSRLVDMTLLEGTKWYWRVRAMNSADTSLWSSSFAFIVTEGSITARTYYIDTTLGKDEYNGRSTTTPWLSLSKVSSMTFNPGDTISLKGGQTFTGGIKNAYTHNDTVNAITYNSYGTGKATIQLGATDTFGVNINYTKHIKVNVKNIKVNGVYNPITESGGIGYQYGISVYNYTLISPIDSNKISQVNISNCEISNIRTAGIIITPGDFGKTVTCHIDSNLVYNIGGGGIGISFNWLSNSRIYGNTVHDVYGLSTSTFNTAIAVNLCKDIAIERNLIYNIGKNSVWSGLGIVPGASKNIRIRYNEIYNVYSNSHTDGEAIDIETGSDSCLVEFNYIHNQPGTGILISGDASRSSIINNYKTYATYRGSIDSGSADFNVVRYNLIKNIGRDASTGTIGIKVSSGGEIISIPGRNNQIYNNSIIFSSRLDAAGIVLINHNDSTKIFNNLVIGDSLLYFYTDSASTKRYSYVNNNMYWDRDNLVNYFTITSPYTFFTSIQTWSTSTGWEATKYIYNPLLASPLTTTGDTLNNPFLIETMTKYIPIDGSVTRNLGVSLSSYTRSAPTVDMRGISISGNVGIGAFIDTTSSPYPYQAETKRWVGRMDTLQTAAQMKTKDSLIIFMKADTLLSKMDLFYLFANLDSGSANINIVSDSFKVTAVNGPTFTTQEGYTGNGTSTYLNTNWAPSTNGIKYLLDSANASVYSMSSVIANSSLLGTGNAGTNLLRIIPNNGTSLFVGAINENATPSTTNTTTIGLFSVTRTAVTQTYLYKSDTLLNSKTGSSSALSDKNLFILARNGNGSPTEYTTGKVSAVTIGGKLNEYSHYALTDNLEWYLHRVGTSKTPLKARLTSPATGDTGVSLTTDLKWARMRNKTSFHIQLSYLSDFSVLVGEMTGVDTNVYHVGGSNPGSTGSVTLVNNQTHYWRVRGINSAGNGPWSNTFSFTTPTNYDPSSISLFSRFPYASSTARKELIDSLIKQLKADTIWSKIDVMYMYASEDTANAKVNWISSSYTSSLLGSTKPTFTAEQGFTGNGSTAYLSTNYTPSTNGVNYTTDSASVFVYVRTGITENKYVIGVGGAGVNFMRLNPRNTAFNYESYLNTNTASTTATSGTLGLFSMIRYSSANYKVYRNDSLLNTIANTSSTRPTLPIFVLCRNGNTAATDFTTRQVAFVMAGGKFSDFTQTVIHRRIEWYLNRIGAYVLVPSRVLLTSPANSATGVSISTDFDWDNVGANYYQIEIDDDIAFGSLFYSANCSGSEELNDNIGGFNNNTTYYWRVRGVNSNGTGAWSSTYSFTTTP